MAAPEEDVGSRLPGRGKSFSAAGVGPGVEDLAPGELPAFPFKAAQEGVATLFRRRLSLMEKLKKDVTLIAATLEALAANVKANTEDQKRMAEDQKRMAEDQRRTAVALEGMAARGKLMDEDLQSLKGPFASIGEHLIRLFERDAEMRAWRETMEARVEALEKRQPPAA